jgi:2-isopropylmalate synthase
MSKDKVEIFDTTLRDGEQAAGTRLGAREKVEIARQLVRLNVDIIEAGFPASSPEDFEAVRLISEQIEGPVICGLTRARIEDIEVCRKALAKAKRARIHTGIGVSEIHIAGKFADDKYGKTMGEKQATILKMAVEAVRHTAGYVEDIEFYAEDSGRADRAFLYEILEAVIDAGATVLNIPEADRAFLYEILEAVIDAGATVLNIPDTTGYSMPEQYGGLIREIRANVPNVAKAIISVHCHNDLGLAVANSLAGVKNGARQVEGTINGVGERAGNAAIEEVVMAMHTRRDFFEGVETNINTREFHRSSRMVADMLGMPVPANKAVVGHNAFAHSSGIHVDGFLKKRETYEIMRPEDIGLAESRVVLTARTGRHGLRHRLEEMGYTLSEEELEKTYERFLAVADKKNEVFDEDLAAIISDEIHAIEQVYELQYLHVACGTGTLPTASVKIITRDETKQAAACGDGPVDAAYEAIRIATGQSPKLEDYSIRAVTGGKEALGEATVRITGDGRTFVGRGISTDIIEASAKAYVDAINRMVSAQSKD